MDVHSSKIYEIAKAKQILTISGDKKCALETCCALVIHDSGSIEILLNESTLKQLGIEMDAAYRLMAKRV